MQQVDTFGAARSSEDRYEDYHRTAPKKHIHSPFFQDKSLNTPTSIMSHSKMNDNMSTLKNEDQSLPIKQFQI